MQKELVDLLKSLPVTQSGCSVNQTVNASGSGTFTTASRRSLELSVLTRGVLLKGDPAHTGTLMHKKGVPVTAIKDQLRHRTSKTTEDFYIGADHDYQRQMAERLELNSGKIVGRGVISTGETVPNA